MTYLISVIVFLLVFSILILVHELGHFFAARKAGVKVEEFGLGLPPRAKRLWTDKLGTLYSLNWIPFGGFIRMYGEDSTDEKLREKGGSFASKSITARTIIILGGVVMNFLLGFILLSFLFSVGTEPFVVNAEDFQKYRDQGLIIAEDQVLVSDFSEGSPAINSGLQVGDVIVRADGVDVFLNNDVVMATAGKVNSSVNLLVMRGEESLTISVPVNAEGKMGVVISETPNIIEVKKIQLPIPAAIAEAGYQTVRLSYLTMKMFIIVIFDLFTKAEISDQVSGPVGIAQITHITAQEGGFMGILRLIAILSISLGAINVLPIPALDGGRFMSILFEFFTRRRPNAAWEARIHAFGFVLIIILIFAVTYNDILKLIAG